MQETNRQYYEQAYTFKSNLRFSIYRRFSFDQQLKHKVNQFALKKVLNNQLDHLSVLEVGCGLGLNLSFFPNTSWVYGVDLAFQSVYSCSRYFKSNRSSGFGFCVADGSEGIPFKQCFDLIICSHVLEHIIDDQKLISEFHRVLKPLGTLLINIPINEQYSDPKHVHTYTKKSIEKLLEDNKFHLLFSDEYDKWSFFFTRVANGESFLPYIFYKPMRAILAIFPLKLSRKLADYIIKDYPNQQNVVCCNKKWKKKRTKARRK